MATNAPLAEWFSSVLLSRRGQFDSDTAYMAKNKDDKMDKSRNRLSDYDAAIERGWTKQAKAASRGKTDGTSKTDFDRINDSRKKN